MEETRNLDEDNDAEEPRRKNHWKDLDYTLKI